MINFHIGDQYQVPVNGSQQHLDCDLYQNADMTMLSDRLRKEREAQKLTQEQLAEKAKCGQSNVGNLESGNQKTSKHIPAIAAALGLEAIWLQNGSGPKYRVADNTEAKPAESNVTVIGKDSDSTTHLCDEAIALAVTFMSLSPKRQTDLIAHAEVLAAVESHERSAADIKRDEPSQSTG